jgi:hypothetical protein
MNWYERFRKMATRSMPIDQALRTLGLTAVPSSLDELRMKRKQMRTQNLHPDQGGSPQGMVDVNNAFDSLKDAISEGAHQYSGPTQPDYSEEQQPTYTGEHFQSIKAKLNPRNFPGMSPIMASVLGYLFGEK